MSDSKITTYIGFAIKMNAVALGVDNILSTRKPIRLILADSSLSENSLAKLNALKDRRQLPLFELAELERLSNKAGCKAIAITNPELAKQIMQILNNR